VSLDLSAAAISSCNGEQRVPRAATPIADFQVPLKVALIDGTGRYTEY
jgi:hypothetical protein